MDYINKPIGNAKVPPGQLKPLIAVPTTAGTGSESTAMCVLDILSMKVKTGISHWRLRPTLAVIDPLLTMSLPPEVTAAAGMDITCHALEYYTARYYTTFDRKKPEERVTYCGSNPVSDLWCEKALMLLARSPSRSAQPWDAARKTFAAQLPVSFAAVSQHLGVLRSASLVTVRADGKRRLYRADHDTLAPFADMLRTMWTTDLDRLAAAAEAEDVARAEESP